MPVPQDVSGMVQFGSSYAPLATNLPWQPQFGLEGLPFPGGVPGMFARMAAQPAILSMAQGSGFVPLGVGHDQNIFDAMQRMRFTQMAFNTMQTAAQSDREGFVRSFRGLAALSGQPFGGEQRRAAETLAEQIVTASPIMAQIMPDFVDRLAGMRGSAAVMSQRMLEGGRYRVDPVTGRLGMSAETVGTQTQLLFRDMFGQNLSQMAGLSAGQVGSMYQELVTRGMIAGPAGTHRDRTMGAVREMGEQDLRAAMGRVAARTGMAAPVGGLADISPEFLDKLSLDPAVADRMRSFDAMRIKRSLQSYVGLVGAMRDIFGDMGHPNAPMQQLMAGIEALSQGSMAQISPGRLTGMVRETYNLATATGVPMNTALAMQHHAAARAAALGIEPVFAIQANQGGMAFGGAYRSLGNAAHTAWGAMDATQLQQLDTNLRIGAAASNMANRAGALMRIRETAGGFGAGTEAAAIAEALGQGLGHYRFGGQTRVIPRNDNDLIRILRGATDASGRPLNLSEGYVRDILMQGSLNREQIERHGMMDTVRGLQAEVEVNPFIAGRFAEALMPQLSQQFRGQGVNQASARRTAMGISQRVVERMMQLNLETFSTREGRNAGIAEILNEELMGPNASPEVRAALGNMTPEQRDNFLRMTAERAYGSADHWLQQSQYNMSLQTAHRINSRETRDQADRTRMETRLRGMMQDAMAPLGRGSLLQRVVAGLQNARPEDTNNIQQVIGQIIGVRTGEINEALTPVMQQIVQHQRRIEELRTQYSQTTDTAQRADILRQLETAHRELRAFNTDAVRTAETFGIFTEGISPEDTRRAITSTNTLAAMSQELTALRGGLGDQVSANQIAVARGQLGGRALTQAQAQAVLIGRRQAQAENITEGDIDLVIAQNRQAGITMTREQARASIQTYRRDLLRGPQTFTQQELAPLMAAGANLTDTDITAIVRHQRSQLPGRATPEEISALRAANPTWSEGEATNLANMRAMARRLGVDAATDLATPESIRAAITRESARRWEVSDADITTAIQQSGGRIANTPEGRAQARSLILQRRFAQQATRFSNFWSSAEGAEFRETTERSAADVEGHVAGLSTNQMVSRLGTRALTMQTRLRNIQSRLHTLAMMHTGGNMAKLMAGDLGIDPSQPGAQELEARVHAERAALFAEQQTILQQIHDSQGRSGRQWEQGTEAEARQALGLPAQGPLSEADQRRLDTERLRRGSELEARRMLGLADTGAVDPARRRELEQLTYDVNVARRLNPQQETALRQFHQHERMFKQAAEQLGVTPEALRQAFTRPAAERERRFTALSTQEASRRSRALQKWQAGDRAGAEALVAGDAAGRGVSVENYLTGTAANRGFMTSWSIRSVEDSMRLVTQSQTAVEQAARDLGLGGIADFAGVFRVFDHLGRMAAGARDVQSAQPAQIVQGLYEAFGLRRPGDNDPTAGAVAGDIGRSAGGRGLATTLLGTQRTLLEIAGRGAREGPGTLRARLLEQAAALPAGSEERRKLEAQATALGRGGTAGVDVMLDRYRTAMAITDMGERKTALSQFYRDFGFGVNDQGQLTEAGQRQLTTMEAAMRFQLAIGAPAGQAERRYQEFMQSGRRAGFMEFGEGRQFSESSFGRLIGSMLQPSGPSGGQGGQGGQSGQGRHEIGGTIYFPQLGMSGNFQDAWLRTNQSVVPPSGG